MSRNQYLNSIHAQFPNVPFETISKVKDPKHVLDQLQKMKRAGIPYEQAELFLLDNVQYYNVGDVQSYVDIEKKKIKDYVCSLPGNIQRELTKTGVTRDIADNEALLLNFYLSRFCLNYIDRDSKKQNVDRVVKFMQTVNVPANLQVWFYPYLISKFSSKPDSEINRAAAELSDPCGQSILKSTMQSFSNSINSFFSQYDASQRNFSNKDLVDNLVAIIEGVSAIFDGYTVTYHENLLFDADGRPYDVKSEKDRNRFSVCIPYFQSQSGKKYLINDEQLNNYKARVDNLTKIANDYKAAYEGQTLKLKEETQIAKGWESALNKTLQNTSLLKGGRKRN